MIYLDYNATAPLRPAARAAWLAAQDEGWANPSSVHGLGQQARHRLDQAKAAIARLLGASVNELVMTSGGTEANALAIRSALVGAPADAEIVCSAIEHSSVLRNSAACASVRQAAVDACGRLSAATLQAAITPRTRLVCLQFANNELGTLQDVPALSTAIRAANPTALILLDACQGTGKRAYDLHALGVDFAAVAGHKVGAPKGVGVLYVRNGLRVTALLSGGRQQQDRRSGTEDAAAASALAAALADALAQAPAEDARQRALLAHAWERLARELPSARWLAHDAERMANTMSLAHPGCANETLVQRLDLAGFAVSKGSACMAGRGEPSHVIAALGLDPSLARSVVRVSIGAGTTAAELDAFVTAYVREVLEVRQSGDS